MPALAAADVAAPRTECALKMLTSMPELASIALSHLATVDDETALYGLIIAIDLLPNYGPGTSKRYGKPVTTGNTVISNCEKRNFRRSSDLAEAKI